MTLVVDASLVTAALIDGGTRGAWAEEVLASDFLVAPHLMPVEVASILRRAARSGDISEDAASLAHTDLLDIDIEFFPHFPFAGRIWELRANLTAYDAWYVALAEELDAKLATLDERMSRAVGPRCEFVLPPSDMA